MFDKKLQDQQYRLSPRNRRQGNEWLPGWSIDERHNNGRNWFWNSMCVYATRIEAAEAMNFMKDQNK